MSDFQFPQWVSNVLLIVGVALILLSIFVNVSERQEKQSQNNLATVQTPPSTSSVLDIERREPSNRPPLLLEIILMLISLLMLALGSLQTYLIFFGEVIFQFNWIWIAFYIVFVVFPLWVLLAPFTFDRKYYKQGKSATAIDAKFVIDGDILDVFNRCSHILEMMQAKPYKQETPSLIKAHINKSKISLEVSHSNGNVQVHVMCDASWVTVKIGKGRNQNIINEFQKHLIDQFRRNESVSNGQRVEVLPITHKRRAAYERTEHLMWAGLQVTNTSANELKDVQVSIIECLTLTDNQDSANQNDFLMWNHLEIKPFCVYWSERQAQPEQMNLVIPSRATRLALIAFQDNSNGHQFNFNSLNHEWIVGGVKIDVEISSHETVLWNGDFYLECHPNYLGGKRAIFEFVAWNTWIKGKNITQLESDK
ncbi:hypothetical protein ACFLW1_02130 [Chloroflexota bacterium]